MGGDSFSIGGEQDRPAVLSQNIKHGTVRNCDPTPTRHHPPSPEAEETQSHTASQITDAERYTRKQRDFDRRLAMQSAAINKLKCGIVVSVYVGFNYYLLENRNFA